jgi:uncharacterized protein
MKTTLLKSEDYTRSPWKNGGGIFTDIADAHRADAPVKDWDSLLWRFASTPIVATGPFSHMPGIDRLQMVVGGRGLVLKSPTQEFDEREPFTTVRFTGELEIVTRLEEGPVEVVNLMGRRGAVALNSRRSGSPVSGDCPPARISSMRRAATAPSVSKARILRFRTTTH